MVVFRGEIGAPAVLGDGCEAGVGGCSIVGTDDAGRVNLIDMSTRSLIAGGHMDLLRLVRFY